MQSDGKAALSEGLANDWTTLLRQLEDQMRLLIDAPFLKGDLEAELRLRAMLSAQDMEELDAATDRLAAYVSDRLNAVARLQALAEGRDPPAPRNYFATGNAAASVARRGAAAGPSGSDFVIDAQKTLELSELSRGPVRL